MNTIVIGSGYWGVNYIKELSHNLVAVVETNQERAEWVQETYNVQVFPDLPDDLEYDGAIICTPPESHIPIAASVLESGRFALIEKPLAPTMEQAFRIKKWANKAMMAHIYLYHPDVIRMKSFLTNWVIDHTFAQRTNQGPVRPWQNAAWDLAPHEISIFNWLFNGPPHTVSAMGTRDYALLRLEYVAVDAAIYVSWLGGPKVRRIEFAPPKGERVVFDDVATILEITPMRRMLSQFLSGDWDERGSYDAALDVLAVLESTGLPGIS